MRKFFLFLFFLAGVGGGSFFFARWWNDHALFFTPAAAEKPRIIAQFRPAPFVLQNHPFTLVIVGHNNGAAVAQTLTSVFTQNYENYRLIYIDDASDDGSYDLARDLIYDSDHIGQVTLVRNEERLGTLANLFRAVQTCPDQEIIVVLHGEDWLAHEWVLQRLNAYYADPDLWITYGQYRDYPTYELGICRDAKETNLRGQPFLTSHLKTFYASLFKKIRESDLVYGGKFLPACAEMAYMIPMLEMAGEHSQFITEVFYIANRLTAHREERESAIRSEKYIRALAPYATLESLLCGG